MRRSASRILGTAPNIRWLVSGIVAVAILCAVVARWLAPQDFPSFGRALWWSVQTVTTVGYGDVSPKSAEGRVIAALLMISAIAFVSVLTASIAAGFIQRQQVRRKGEDPVLASLERIESRIAALEQRLLDERAPSGADG
jgi:voltage-gated potassium channel